MTVYKNPMEGLLIIPDVGLKLKSEETVQIETPSENTNLAISKGLLVEAPSGAKASDEKVEAPEPLAVKAKGPRGQLRTSKFQDA